MPCVSAFRELPGGQLVRNQINGKKQDFSINKGLFQRETKIDISRMIEDGPNSIVFYPAACPLKMYVELVEKYPEKFCDGKCEFINPTAANIEAVKNEVLDDNN